MKTLFRKTILFALVAALGVASLPFARVSAAGAYDPPLPPRGEISNQRLEQVWARQLRMYGRMGHAADFVNRIQQLIDRARENGKDVSAVQAALEAFEAALKDAHPIYESAKGIVTSHQGFDVDRKVTDTEKAKETVRAMGGKLRDIRAAMNGTGRALLEALRAFQEANPRPQQVPAPEGG